MSNRTAFLAIACAALSACASLTEGTSQTIIFDVSPKDARCDVSRDGVEIGTFVGRQNTLTVSKGAKDIIVACRADGHVSKTQRLVSSTQTAGMLSFLFIDFGITDMMTGAMWKYPSDASVSLERDPNALRIAADAPAAPANSPPSNGFIAVSDIGGLRQHAFSAARLARVEACNADPEPVLTARGPNSESYAVPCGNGDALMVRCEWGRCRVLK